MAETQDLAIAPNLNFSQQPFRSGSLVMQTVQSNQYGSSINITASVTPVMFNLPTIPFNLSQSMLCYTVTIPQPTAGNYVWTFADVLAEIKQIQFFGPNNQLIVDLDNANVASKFITPREMSFDEYISNDPMNKIYASNSLNNVVPALRNGSASSLAGGEVGANPSYRNYIEQAHFNVGAISAAVTYNVQLPLRFFKDTLFAVNKNLYFDQITYLKVYFANIGRVCYMSTSNANPSAGVVSNFTALAGANPSAPQIEYLQLYLATESDPDECAMLVKQVQDGAIDMMIPWCQMFNNSNSGTSQNINIQLDSGLGQCVTKIYHSIFSTDSSQVNDQAYDNSNNVQGMGSNQPQKTLQFYTQYNGRRLQNITPDCTTAGPFTDYMLQKNSLKGSVLDSLSQYHWSWHWLDDFSGLSPDYIQASKDDLIAGKRLGAVPVTYQFVGQNMRATGAGLDINAFSHYTYVCTMKHLTISRGQILVQ